jgi:hypothetical protein
LGVLQWHCEYVTTVTAGVSGAAAGVTVAPYRLGSIREGRFTQSSQPLATPNAFE